MKNFQFALILLSALALSGCVRGPPECGSVPPAKLSGCIYTNAVMGQDPFGCYSISDLNQRARCIKDASDPSARTQLQRTLPEERGQAFAESAPPLQPKPNATAKPEAPAKPGQAPSGANATANPAPAPITGGDPYCNGKYPDLYEIGDTECNITEADCTCWDATDRLCLPQRACR